MGIKGRNGAGNMTGQGAEKQSGGLTSDLEEIFFKKEREQRTLKWKLFLKIQ